MTPSMTLSRVAGGLKRGMAAAVFSLSMSGLSLPAQVKPAVLAGEPEEAKLSREELRVSLEHVAPMRLRLLETGAEIERLERPVLQYAPPMWGGHHGTL